MATVYRGYDPAFDREVAIKVLPREFLHDPSFQERFRHEARLIASLEHPAIVPVYYFGEDDGQPFIVMRYMAGGSLAGRLAQGPLSPAEAHRILAVLAPALDEAHERGILHRDLKPGNILFDQRNAPYIADFGIAKLIQGSQGISSTGGVIGTPAYMSPEQARGESGLDRRSDLYAVGALLFEMITGRLPYQADTPMGMALRHITDPVPRIAEATDRVPAALQIIIDRAMAKQREDRYPTARALVEALGQVITQGQVPAPQPVPPTETIAAIPLTPPTPEVPKEMPRRGISAAWLLVYLGLLGTLAFLGWTMTGGGADGLLPPVSGSETATIPAETLLSTVPTPPTQSGVQVTPSPTLFTIATPSPSSGSTKVSEADGMTLVLVPAGVFVMGALNQDAEPRELPQHTITLDAFWIDQTEVTNSMYARCVADSACDPPNPESSETHERYFGAEEFDAHPVINVSWDDATNYCAWAGRRLPTEAEWEKAARGTDGRTFPWGNEEANGTRLNFCDENCPREHKNATIADGSAETAPVGNYPNGQSPFGALDMSGNVWEWVNDRYAENYYSVSPSTNPPGPESGEDRVHRGGAWDDIVRPVTARGVLGPESRFPFLGFRCAMTQ